MTAIEPDVRSRGRSGRPRSHAADEAILSATLDLVREHGYGGLTMSAVIERAGVSSATLYRRWSTKHDLVVAALDKVRPEPTASDTGSLAGDLREYMSHARAAVEGGWVELVEAIGVHARRDEDLAAALRERFLTPRAAELKAILRRALERGELQKVPPIETALSFVTGPLYYHAVRLGERLTDSFVAAACDYAVAALQSA